MGTMHNVDINCPSSLHLGGYCSDSVVDGSSFTRDFECIGGLRNYDICLPPL